MEAAALRIVVDSREAEQTLKKFSNSLDQVGRKAKSTVGGFDKLKQSVFGLKGAFTGLFTVLAVKEVLQVADSYTLLNGRLGLVTNSTEELIRVQDSLYEVSKQTRSSYEQTADLYTKIARATKELGIAEADRISITESLNKAFIVSGASQEAAGNATLQLTQALQGGIYDALRYRVLKRGGGIKVYMQ